MSTKMGRGHSHRLAQCEEVRIKVNTGGFVCQADGESSIIEEGSVVVIKLNGTVDAIRGPLEKRGV